jgi:hypothetical protein
VVDKQDNKDKSSIVGAGLAHSWQQLTEGLWDSWGTYCVQLFGGTQPQGDD